VSLRPAAINADAAAKEDQEGADPQHDENSEGQVGVQVIIIGDLGGLLGHSANCGNQDDFGFPPIFVLVIPPALLELIY
jgi:hypothetical protein